MAFAHDSPVFCITIADLHVPARALQQIAGRVVVQSRDDADDAAAAILQLLRGRLHVDHQVAVGLADADHRGGGEDVQHHLRRGAGLQARRAGEHFRSDARRDDQVDEVREVRARPARDEDDAQARLARARQRAADERRHAAGRNADHDVLLRRTEAGDRARALLVIILDAFFRLEHRVLAARHDRLHHIRRRAERRRHLGGFDHAEAAAGAGADEDDAAAAAERFRQHFDAVREAVAFALDRRDDLAVFGDHQVDDVLAGGLVEVEAVGIDCFGGKDFPFGLRGHNPHWTPRNTGRRGYYSAGVTGVNLPADPVYNSLTMSTTLIDAYLDHLRVVRRLADHTTDSYRRDLALLGRYAAGREIAARGARSRRSRSVRPRPDGAELRAALRRARRRLRPRLLQVPDHRSPARRESRRKICARRARGRRFRPICPWTTSIACSPRRTRPRRAACAIAR